MKQAYHYILPGSPAISLEAESFRAIDRAERAHAAAWIAFRKPELPAPELTLLGVFSANGRRRLVHRITVAGQEIGTATEWPDRAEHPWSLTVPGHCGNLRQCDLSALLATVSRILSTGSIWS